MKALKFALPLFISSFLIFSCNNSNTSQNQPGPGTDTTSTNPTSDAQDYHPDQRQTVPVTDSSNVIGTDTVNSSTVNKDSAKKH